MSNSKNNLIKVVIADDERPARSFLAAMLREFEEVDLVGEAENGAEAIELIEELKPDLALLDLQMPEIDGLGVARMLRKAQTPLIVFVTAYDEFAVRAFEVNAVDYLLKPVERPRLREAIARAQERLERTDLKIESAARVAAAADDYAAATRQNFLERIPVRQQEEITLVRVNEIAAIVADGELLHLTTERNQRYTLSYRLKDLEARLNPEHFVRLGRGTLANVEMIKRVAAMPGGTYLVTMSNGQQLSVSRIQGRLLKEQFLTL